MLACNIEYESPLWRDGMTFGLDAGIFLGWQHRHDEDRLHYELLRRIVETAPRPYRRYLRAYCHQPIYPGIVTQLLSHWQWRTYAAELADLARTAAPGDREEILRNALFLAPGEASAAPYEALLAAGESVDPAPQFDDGCIDAAIYCSSLLDESDLTPDEYVRAAVEVECWLVPQDYLRYAQRCLADRAARKKQNPRASYFSPLRPKFWRENVAALAAEIARCEAAGEGKSQLWLDLVKWLLLEPNEGVPNSDWEMPPAMQEYLARLKKMAILA